MKLIVLALVLNLSFAEETKWGEAEDDHVTVLTNSNFQAFVDKHPKVFVKFYAPWCGHCKAMAPAYSKLAEKMKNDENGIPIAKVDATVEKELAEKYQIQGFPALKLFVNGEPIEYNGERTEEAILEWISSKNDVTLKELKTEAELEEFLKENLAVLFVVNDSEKDILKKFQTFTMNYEDVPFAVTHSEDIRSKLDITQKYGFVVVRGFDDGNKFLVLDELKDMAGFKQFFDSVKFPIVMKFDQQAAERIFGTQASAIVYFSDDEDEGYKVFKTFASENANKILFSHSFITKDLGARLAEYIGITSEDTGSVRILKFESGNLDKFKIADTSATGLK